MTRALIRKELSQHWLPLLALLFLAIFGYALVALTAIARGDTGSAFESLRFFVMIIAILGSLILGGRLVVSEYQAKTQLFLAALPVSRVRMLAIKYVLGFSVLLAIVTFAFAIVCLIRSGAETVTPRFTAILAARIYSYCWCAYSFFFMMSMLGRYRTALYLMALLAVMALDTLTDIKLSEFGPIVLLNEKFSFEREVFPVEALQVTLALAFLFLTIAFALGLTREGSVASLLAEKMSHREKIFVATFVTAFAFMFALFDERKKKQPFDLPEAVTETRPGIAVKVSPGSSPNRAKAKSLAKVSADELESMRDYLGLGALPPVFVTLRRDLDAHRYERGVLKQSEGLYARVNYEAPEWNEKRFFSWLIREVLIVRSQSRVKLERKMWVLDGFSVFWSERANANDSSEERKQPLLRALLGTASGFSESDLRNWLTVRERLGDDIAAGVAWFGLKSLAQHQGSEACRKFLRAVLGASSHKDIRAFVYERKFPLDRLMQSEAGISMDDFLQQWKRDLDSARIERSAELRRVPSLKGEVTFVPLSPATRKVHYRLEIDPPPESDLRYSFLYQQLPVLDEEVNLQTIKREQNIYHSVRESDLPGSYGKGSRFYWTFAVEVPELGCRVISGWKRKEIE